MDCERKLRLSTHFSKIIPSEISNPKRRKFKVPTNMLKTVTNKTNKMGGGGIQSEPLMVCNLYGKQFTSQLLSRAKCLPGCSVLFSFFWSHSQVAFKIQALDFRGSFKTNMLGSGAHSPKSRQLAEQNNMKQF